MSENILLLQVKSISYLLDGEPSVFGRGTPVITTTQGDIYRKKDSFYWRKGLKKLTDKEENVLIDKVVLYSLKLKDKVEMASKVIQR